METLKDFIQSALFENDFGQYGRALFNFVALVTVMALAKRLIISHLARLAKKTASDFDDFLVSLLAQIGLPVFITTSLYFVTQSLDLDKQVHLLIHHALVIVVTVRIVLILQTILRYSISKTYNRARPSDPSAETVIKNLVNIGRWALWALGSVFILDNLGVDISTLVAGLGIGGVAVALAAQAVLGDLFSALSIFIDKPFEVGDFIIVEDMMGTVEYVGMKTTRIRSLSGEQLILANSDLTKSRIKNYKRMQTRRVVLKIGVIYQTSLEQVRKIPEIIKKIIQETKGVTFDRSHFESFGDFSLNFETVYFVASSDYNVYMDKQQQINTAIKQRFEEEKIEFAYPTQMLYLSRTQ